MKCRPPAIWIVAASPPRFARRVESCLDIHHASWSRSLLMPLKPLMPVQGVDMMSTLGFETSSYSEKTRRVSGFVRSKPTTISNIGPRLQPLRTSQVPVPPAPPQSSATSW